MDLENIIVECQHPSVGLHADKRIDYAAVFR